MTFNLTFINFLIPQFGIALTLNTDSKLGIPVAYCPQVVKKSILMLREEITGGVLSIQYISPLIVDAKTFSVKSVESWTDVRSYSLEMDCNDRMIPFRTIIGLFSYMKHFSKSMIYRYATSYKDGLTQ